ncbi:MAG: hypothetical protein CSB06_00185 [Bacteroidia bacterium]|nr:MAG: hypothetical protein CSB06_00185 [Bacteroidia bacterium]
MKKITYILILLANPIILLGQQTIKGKIIDNDTNEPIPYVNIWVKNTNIGTTSSLQGVFSIRSDNLSDTCSIVCSAVGYQDTSIAIKNFKNTLKLSPVTYNIEEVAVYPQKKRTFIVNDLSDKKIGGGIMNDTTPLIEGRYFPYKPDYENYPYIEKILIYTHDAKRGKLNLRLYSFDTLKVEPIKELVSENIIAKTKVSIFKTRPTVIDVSKHKIKFPENGILIGVEWLIIPENTYKVTHTYADSKKKIVKIHYAPDLGATIDKQGYRYIYKQGNWHNPSAEPQIKGSKHSRKHFNPAISLILTN